MGDLIRPEEIVGKWLRDKGKECFDLRTRVKELELEVVVYKDKVSKQIATMQTLATILGLPYPDPRKIIAEVTRLKEK